MSTETVKYDDAIVRRFALVTILWGVVGMLAGLWLALELASVDFNVTKELAFGRLRPLHTNAVIFAFVGSAMFAGIYYSTQRLLKTRMLSDKLSKANFWGWQAVIVAAAVTLPLGVSTSKEYAELEWPIDIAIAAVAPAFGLLGTVGGMLHAFREVADSSAPEAESLARGVSISMKTTVVALAVSAVIGALGAVLTTVALVRDRGRQPEDQDFLQ